MRGKLLIALIVLFLVPGTASATTAERYVGYGSPVEWTGCATTIEGPVNTGFLAGIDAVGYQNCQPPGLVLEVNALLPWEMHATSPSDYTITDIELDFSGPFCEGTVSGWAGASYDSAARVLTVVQHATVVTYLDPNNDCLGLISVGETVPVLSDTYDIVFI